MSPTRGGKPLTLPEALAAAPRPDAPRERLLHAAVEVLNAEGFSALTQQRVCAVAGLRQSHLTYYFPTRIDLLREAAAYGCEAMLGAVARAIDEGTVTRANLRATLNADVTDRRWARLLNALIAACDEDPTIRTWLAHFNARARKRLLVDFRRLGLALAQADVDLFYATFVGAVQLDLGESTPASLARTRRSIGAALDRLVGTTAARGDSRRGKEGA